MTELLDNNSQGNPNDKEWERMVNSFVSRFSGGKSGNVPRYEYGRSENIEEIMKNPEEYIIPECLEACKKLWSKNIETLMCANYMNDDLFVVLPGIDSLSAENQNVFKDNNGSGFIFGEEHNNPEIKVARQTQKSALALVELAEKLKIQDVRRCRYQTAEEFLEEYKFGDMPAEYTGVDENGYVSVTRQYNPQRIDATLQDALEQTGKAGLYIPSEGRVYESQMFLDWHNRYLESKDSNQ